MAKDDEKAKEPVVLKEGEVVVPQSQLTQILEAQAESDRKIAEMEAQVEGMKQLSGAADTSEPKLREKKNFEPKFRTVRIRKYPMKGNVEDLGYVTGWSNRGAYQMVDKSGVAPVIIDMLDIQFLGHERDEKGKLQFEAVPLLSLYNKGVQVHCKIIKTDREDIKVPTGEEIDVTVYDPKHGMMATGEKIDGWVAHSEITYTIQIPGVSGETKIDGLFVN